MRYTVKLGNGHILTSSNSLEKIFNDLQSWFMRVCESNNNEYEAWTSDYCIFDSEKNIGFRQPYSGGKYQELSDKEVRRYGFKK